MSKEKIYLAFVGILVSPGIVMLAQHGNLWGWALIGGAVTFAILALRTIKEKKVEKQRRERIIGEISDLLTEGNSVCNFFNPKGLPNGPVDKCLEIKYFHAWQKRCGEVLTKNNMKDWEALFLADTSFNRRGSTVHSYISACKAGLKRLEYFLKDLRKKE